MDVGFTVISRPAGTEVRLFGQPQHTTRLVSYARTEAAWGVCMGDFYYQEACLTELARHEPPAVLQTCTTSKAALLLALYRTEGIHALTRLDGHYAAVIGDTATGCVLGARDVMGGYPLFWAVQADTVAFSTSVRPLLALLPSRTLNLEYLAEFLMAPGPRNEGAGEACAYAGIHRVVPRTTVRLYVATRRVERHHSWDWLEHRIDPGTTQLQDIAEHYRELLTAAVRERMRGRTAAHLSGGMDSTSVALLARELIRSGVREAPLHTLSLVYPQLPVLAQERPYLDSVLSQDDAWVAHLVPTEALLNFGAFGDAPLHEEPYAGLWRLETDRALVQVAAQAGAATMLSGAGADDLLEGQPFYLADLLRRGRLLKVWRDATTWARARNGNVWDILSPFGFAPLTAAWRQSGLGHLWRRSPRPLHEHHEGTIPPWVVPDFARRYDLRGRAHANARQIYGLCRHPGLSVALRAITNMAGDVVRWSVATPLGVTIAHPFLDRRLVCFGLGLQERLPPQPGQMKPVLAEAMRGMLPDRIRHRRTKGHFSEVYHLGLARHLPSLSAMVRQAPVEALGIFDTACMLRCLHEATVTSANAQQLQRLDFTLALLQWLCMEEAWQRTPLPAAAVKFVRAGDPALSGTLQASTRTPG